jgi:CheY-like chemotaxis protein
MKTYNYENDPRVVHPKINRRRTRQPMIMIVDDNIDSAVLVDTMFRHLKCQTHSVLSWKQAKNEIFAINPDLIILDWLLDRDVTAADFIKNCTQTLDRFPPRSRRFWNPRTKIITHSSLKENQITPLQNIYFEHLDHWTKSENYHELLKRALDALEIIKF